MPRNIPSRATQILQHLLDIGFQKVGKWRHSAGKIVYDLDNEAESRNILYAFESDSEILYIGKTTKQLKARMKQYQNPGRSQVTNIRNNANLKQLLDSGASVSILALPDHGLFKCGVFHINLAAALEDDIVSQLKPKWNKAGT